MKYYYSLIVFAVIFSCTSNVKQGQQLDDVQNENDNKNVETQLPNKPEASKKVVQFSASVNNLNISEDTTFGSVSSVGLPVEKYNAIEKIIETEGVKLESFALTSDSSLIPVTGDEWPEYTIVGIDLYRDSVTNRIVFLGEYPVSESGDWFNGYRYFFDENGNTKIFKRISNFFNSECTDDVAFESSMIVFDEKFTPMYKSFSLKDKDGKSLIVSNCYFPYRHEYLIRKNVREFNVK